MKYKKFIFFILIALSFFITTPTHACLESFFKSLYLHCFAHKPSLDYYACFCEAHNQYEHALSNALARGYHHLNSITPQVNSVIIMDVDKTAILDHIEPNMPVLEFYRTFLTKQFHFIFLTTRPMCDFTKTLSILSTAGYHTIFKLICIPDELYFALNPPQTNWKYEMRKELAREYTIEATLDDNTEWLLGEPETTGLPILIPDQDTYAQPYHMSYSELYQRALCSCRVLN